jgi:hypothetical protein
VARLKIIQAESGQIHSMRPTFRTRSIFSPFLIREAQPLRTL